MLRYLTKKKKRERKEANGKAVMEIYDRAKQRGSEEYLVNRQESESGRIAKILAEAEARRKRKGLRKLEQPKDMPSTVAGIYSSKSDSGLFKDSRGTMYIGTKSGTIFKVREEIK